MTVIGNKIATRRKDLSMTQEELAKRMGYKSKSTINKIENGTNDIPQSKIAKFAEVLDTSIAYLMGWEQNQEETTKKIDVTTDIIIRMEKDKNFSEVVQMLYKLDSEKIKAFKIMLNSFS